MKVFILADHHGEANSKILETSQILQEYDYDVIDPTFVEHWERYRILYLDEMGRVKRDFALLSNCEGVCYREDIPETEHTKTMLKIAEAIPWIGKQNIKTLDEWIKE